MKEVLTYDDVLITPRFSAIKSRKDVDLTSKIGHNVLKLPIISSNMDTVTESAMAKAMNQAGAVGCLHRFMSIDDNIRMFKESEVKPWVSFGLGTKELDRVAALQMAGATTFVLDVAHGANMEVVKQVKELDLDDGDTLIVGNFGDGAEVKAFHEHYGSNRPITYKVGIGGGSACTTRIETGCGYPSLGAILSCKNLGLEIIADGGLRTPGDIAKALAAGAKAVMLGGMLAGTDETPAYQQAVLNRIIALKMTEFGFNRTEQENINIEKLAKVEIQREGIKYRGSASKESYEVQGKDESWRTAEGEAFTVPYKGSVANVLSRIEGGLRSSLSYVGAANLHEFQELAEFVKVTNAGAIESGPHGKNRL